MASSAPTSGADWRIYAVAAAASVALSYWAAWAEFIPNPDAALYMRAAELMTQGHWSAALSLFPWPTYSVLIAAVMKLTGLQAFAAAQVINTLLTLVTTTAFIALTGRLANGDRLVILCAAAVILLQPNLTNARASIIRDNGYLAFFVLTLYWVARDIPAPKLTNKLVLVATIAASALFRVEGFLLAFLVPVYYIARRFGGWRQPAVIGTVLVGCLMLVPGLLLWSSGIEGYWLVGSAETSRIADYWSAFSDTIAARIHDLKFNYLYPYGGGNAWGAYVGMVFGIVVVNAIRGPTVPIAILTVFAFFPKRVVPRPANGFVLWFAFGQLPMLLVYTFFLLQLDKRYAWSMALVLDIALAFLLAEGIRQWRTAWSARAFLSTAAVVLVALWTLNVPRPSTLGFIKQAGEWLGREVPRTAHILASDSRIVYYSGRPFDDASRWQLDMKGLASQLKDFDYFLFVADSKEDLPPELVNNPKTRLLRTFDGSDAGSVFVFGPPPSSAGGGQGGQR